MRWLFLATGAYGLALALIGLWSNPVDGGIPTTRLAPVVWLRELLNLDVHQSYTMVELSANVVLFVPLGALALLWWPDWSWLQATAVALVATVTIEVLQEVLRPERFASISDVIANTLGGAIGALLVVLARRRAPALRR